jgi:hypothetical protein
MCSHLMFSDVLRVVLAFAFARPDVLAIIVPLWSYIVLAVSPNRQPFLFQPSQKLFELEHLYHG